MKTDIENLQLSANLSESDKTFLLKRIFYAQTMPVAAWGIILSAFFSWALLWWLKPGLVSPGHVLGLLNQKSIGYLELAETAVTGAAAMSLVFFLIALIGWIFLLASKREKRMLAIIAQLQKEQEDTNHETGNKQ